MKNTLIENITQKKQKTPIDTQMFVDCNVLLKELTITINKNMSNDLKREYGYLFIETLRDIMTLFAKSYLFKDNAKKQEYVETIYEKTIAIDVLLNIFENYKTDDNTNTLGISVSKLVEIKKNIGKIESNLEKWRNSIYNRIDESINERKKEKLVNMYNGL